MFRRDAESPAPDRRLHQAALGRLAVRPGDGDRRNPQAAGQVAVGREAAAGDEESLGHVALELVGDAQVDRRVRRGQPRRPECHSHNVILDSADCTT